MPQAVDVSVANPARVYDWLLCGKDHFSADKAAGRQLLAMAPGAARAAWANRGFLKRAVRFLAEEAGIRQFLDIGAGLPTQGSAHEIAQAVDPLARVLYCDNDPAVTTHANALLAEKLTVTAAWADLRDPDVLFALPVTRTLLDLNKPVAVLLVAVLHLLPDGDNPWKLTEQITERLAPGSYLVISHLAADPHLPATPLMAAGVYERISGRTLPRSREEIARFFTRLDMVDPGLVNVSAWRSPLPLRRPHPALFYAGVGRKPPPADATATGARSAA